MVSEWWDFVWRASEYWCFALYACTYVRYTYLPEVSMPQNYVTTKLATFVNHCLFYLHNFSSVICITWIHRNVFVLTLHGVHAPSAERIYMVFDCSSAVNHALCLFLEPQSNMPIWTIHGNTVSLPHWMINWHTIHYVAQSKTWSISSSQMTQLSDMNICGRQHIDFLIFCC